MASGGEKGTNGWSVTNGFRWKPWLVVAALGFAISLVNATSVLMEWQRDGMHHAAWSPFVWEFSSYFSMLALAPMFAPALAWLPPNRANLPRFVALHAALTIPYSLAHQTGFVILRKLAYALVGGSYDFTHGAPLVTFFYEWRKDLLGYLIILAVYWYFHSREATAAAAPDQRIEIRDGATAVFLPPTDILWVEAAGNYVQFHTAGKTHLVRGTLAAWEAKLTQRGFVRVHRSRLVNRSHIRALKPTPAGDLEITLDDGQTIAGSRRYREALEARDGSVSPSA